ncbi:hypothetical protein EYZ11_013182 [Aspergillus tanneri]|uniref:Uncharacterized protein n=1 Tax=Aspergillus tanneri TaxID=1220188 RepID=A0A4S3IYB3_9EURO|nr:hypothetical protein EYZ11_013182 [Aspergillus tanneri]
MESLLKEQDALLEEVAVVLPKLKTILDLRGTTSSSTWESVKLLMPDTWKVVRFFESHYSTTLDFNNVESWLEQIKEKISKYKENLEDLSEHGVNFNALSDRDFAKPNLEEMMEKVAVDKSQFKLMQKMMPSFFGANWASQRDAIYRRAEIDGESSDKKIPLSTFKLSVNKVANEILDMWKTLRESGSGMKSFKKQWDKLQPEARKSWLQQFTELHRCPGLAIHMLARYPNDRLDKEAFLTPLLNVEDLAEADVLPDMLQTRSSIHPKMFLSTDTRLVELGYWYKSITQMQVEGRMSFYSEIGIDEGGSLYGIQFDPDAFKKPHLTDPAIGLHQLIAQKKTYCFLVSCLSAQIEPSVDPTTSTNRDKYWDYLTDVFRSSADEAMDDLWQLRNDADYWDLRFTDMERNTSKFLHSVFGRIDVFLTVGEKLRVYRNDQQISSSGDLSAIQLSCDDAQITGAISMHATLRSILNEIISSLRGNAWLHRATKNKTLRYLFNLMEKNDPLIRLMGFDVVLRTIERELSGDKLEKAPPFPVVQTLHDMSVVAACMQETSKHYNLILNLDCKYTTLAHDATSEWQERERPWVIPIQKFLKIIQRKGNEFNKEARDENISLEYSHCRFWNSIDDCMSNWNKSDPIVRMILSHAPVPRASEPTSASTILESRWRSQDTNTTPTETMTKKSRKRQTRRKTRRKLQNCCGLSASHPPQQSRVVGPL